MRDKVRTDINVLGTRLRGHAVVDLHDTVRGTYKRVEADNLVTDAYKYHMATCILANYYDCRRYMSGYSGSIATSVFPLADVTLGGLMIFDGELTEDVKNVHFPSDVHLVGYADRGGDATNAMRGTYNNLESGRTDTGHKSVWDFTTSQCNSVIKSLSLTNINAGADPVYGRDMWNVRNMWFPRFDYHDGEHGYAISVSGTTATISKYRIPHLTVKVGDANMTSWSSVASYEVDMSGDANAITYARSWRYAGNGNFYATYIDTPNSDEGGSLNIRVARIHTDDWEGFTYHKTEALTLPGVTARQTSSNYERSVVSGGYLYVCSYEPIASNYSDYARYVYVVDLANVADVRKVDMVDVGVSGRWNDNYHYLIPDCLGGLAFYGQYPSSGGRRGYLYPDGTVVWGSGENSGDIPGADGYSETLRYNCVHNGNYWASTFYTPYLGTICNLDNAVTKTAASTMKITYTLDDA